MHADSNPQRTRPGERGRAGRTAPFHYRVEDGLRVIEVKVPELRHLFESLDPSPPGFRDLDPDVEEYILGAVEEIGAPNRAKLVFYLPAEQLAGGDKDALTAAVHNFFTYRAWASGRNLTRMRRTGLVSLGIGLVFMFVCLLLRRLLPQDPKNTLTDILSEALLIWGWVGMWRPVELLLYDWWPVWRTRRLHERMSTVAVDWREGER